LSRRETIGETLALSEYENWSRLGQIATPGCRHGSQ